MKKIEIEKNFYCYQFEAAQIDQLGVNIYALVNGNEIMFLDAGYEVQMQSVLEDLEGYQIKAVIPSHFHPDHIYGLALCE